MRLALADIRWGWIVAGAVALVAVGVFIWCEWLATYHLVTVEDGVLYRTGNRGLREFANTVRRVKPRTVVCLVDDEEMADAGKQQFKEEEAYLKSRGIKVERIAVKLGGWPTSADLQRFLTIVADKPSRPVLVHCAQGVRRTGMMVAAYQRSIMGYDVQKARAEMLTFGHSRRTVGDIERFLEIYDAQKREMMQELPMSQE